MYELDVLLLTVGLSVHNNHLGPTHYLLKIPVGRGHWTVLQKACVVRRTGSPSVMHFLEIPPSHLRGVYDDVQAEQLLTKNTRYAWHFIEPGCHLKF
jgi:hypothetical protein